ncbi:DUF2971 domain-containing protein [Tepidibacter hydrothermalis]|uniref:DUF2971 domain-containing protein n=1 Tax=Tepidibacter hydrothermalis TaxID=3036126 RepID=A0ABY8E808_9FIRM|nr:DUF2971 domain-containing protein [Tepidibacter hydrothermalis]WFD09026.1 DUF2971 domain-containing protein [Tepidibacter hydrothermalis]
MAYTYSDWEERIKDRTDLTSTLTHLTKPRENIQNLNDDEINILAVNNLIRILKDKEIKGSTTETGYIVGDDTSACFQDAPLNSLIQNIEHEKRRRNQGKQRKVRYCGVGLTFRKQFVFNKGGRPVIYEKTKVAEEFLSENEHWRIVNIDLSEDNNIIDWTHEREWRVKGSLKFNWGTAHIVLPDKECIDYFKEKCPEHILNEIGGISNLKAFQI